eukprot:9472338-Lingulodinium_polyedra.AAC.1
MLLVPVKQRRALLLAPRAIMPGHADNVDVQSKICLAEDVDHVDAQPPREGVQMVRDGLNVPCHAIGQALNDQARSVSAILLLNHTAI